MQVVDLFLITIV